MSSVAANASVVREEMEKILASRGFARNERLGKFLRFVVERQLEGQAVTLKESVIAVEVFGRRPDYDPKLDSIVRTEAARLRARLAEYYAGEGAREAVIIDMPKGGYIPLIQVNENQKENPSVPVVQPEPMASPTRPWRNTVLATGGVLLALSFVWWLSRESKTAGATDPNPSIAVLPFKNLSSEPDSDYFVDGLTDEIIHNFSIIEGLEVRSSTSSFSFKGSQHNPQEIGEKLKVNYVVDGTMQRSGGTLRVTSQFIRVSDDKILWSGKFDKELSDIFKIQDEISRAIVNELRMRLGGRRRYETSVEAYDLYLRVRAQSMVPGNSKDAEAIRIYEQVLAKDASFAPAWAGLAMVHARNSISFPVDNPAEMAAKMRFAADKAIQLDPLLPEAHAALGLMHVRDGRWKEANESFIRAIKLDPNRSDTYLNYVNWFLLPLNRINEALNQLQYADKADPLSPDVKHVYANVLLSAERFDEAESYVQQLPDGHHTKKTLLARVRLGQGKFAESIELLETHPERGENPLIRGFLGYAYVQAGRREEARKMAATAKQPNEQALIFAGLGDKDRTLEALERMSSRGPQRIGTFLTRHEFAFLRGDPRLTTLRIHVGLPLPE